MNLKLAYFVSLILLILVVSYMLFFYVRDGEIPGLYTLSPAFPVVGDEIRVKYVKSDYANYGRVFDPVIPLEVETVNGYEELEFLLDSGAVVSAIPRGDMQLFGITFDDLKRIVVKGHGSRFFAYMSEINVRIGDAEETIPVLFTDSEVGSRVLGRRGFFDQYNIEFNSRREEIIIRGF